MEKNKSREQSTRSDVVRQLKAVRKEQHITQEVLAERAGTKKPIFPDWRAEDIIQVWIF